MKNAIKLMFQLFGLEISKKQKKEIKSRNKDSMTEGLKRIKEKGIIPNTIIDVGAAEGKWSLQALVFWPSADILMMEPLEERKDGLQKLAESPNINYVQAAAGHEKGEVSFLISDDLDGSAVGSSSSYNTRKVPITTIDQEVSNLGLRSPFLIKLDTHGFELPILEGAEKTLSEASVIIIECYGFKISNKALIFTDMCKFMEDKGFRLFDIVDVIRREKDGCMWQCDAFFAKSDMSFFESNTYN